LEEKEKSASFSADGWDEGLLKNSRLMIKLKIEEINLEVERINLEVKMS
jgi:hypothetical protein